MTRLSRHAASWLALVAGVAVVAASPNAALAPAGAGPAWAQRDARPDALHVSILVYHRFGPAVADSMTMRTSTFRWQLQYLKDHGYRVVPLRVVVGYLLRQGPPPPPRSVVITADDGHRLVMTDMLPLVREYGVPVTLFIYPSAISNASYALTWEQLQALARTGLFDVQSHTYWHPNFKVEKRRLATGRVPGPGPDATGASQDRPYEEARRQRRCHRLAIRHLRRGAAPIGGAVRLRRGPDAGCPARHRERFDHGAATIPRHRRRLGQEVRGDVAIAMIGRLAYARR